MGYTKVEHDVMEALYGAELSARELRAFLFLMRETVGRPRPTWPIDLKRMAIAIGTYPKVAMGVLGRLTSMNMVRIESESVSLNLDPMTWRSDATESQPEISRIATESQPDRNRIAAGSQQFVANAPGDTSIDAGPGNPKTKTQDKDTRQRPTEANASVAIVAHVHAREPLPFEAGPVGTIEAGPDGFSEDSGAAGLGGEDFSAAPPAGKKSPGLRAKHAYDADWERRIWGQHPNGANKHPAYRLHLAAMAEGVTLDEIEAGHARYRASDKWTRDGGRYVEALDVWYRNRRWEDQPRGASVVALEASSSAQVRRPTGPQNVTDEAIAGFLAKYGGAS